MSGHIHTHRTTTVTLAAPLPRVNKNKKNAKSRVYFLLRVAHTQMARYYTLNRLQISCRTRCWCLKCVIVYPARDIPAFVMYCVYG